MNDSPLLPEQEKLLRMLVEAVDRIKPDREPFHYMRNMSEGRDLAVLCHRGLPHDSTEVFMGDLESLARNGYIQREQRGRTFEFELTKKAFDWFESALHPGDSDYRTRIALSVRLDDRDRVEVSWAGRTTSLPPRRGLLFLRLILGLKQGELGWVHQLALVDEKLFTESGVTQSVSRLRVSLQQVLGPVDPKVFVEASGDGSIRISTPPRLIQCDFPSLSRSQNQLVVELTKAIQALE